MHEDPETETSAAVANAMTHFHLFHETLRVAAAGGWFLAAGVWGAELRRRNARMRLAYMAPEHVSSS